MKLSRRLVEIEKYLFRRVVSECKRIDYILYESIYKYYILIVTRIAILDSYLTSTIGNINCLNV